MRNSWRLQETLLPPATLLLALVLSIAPVTPSADAPVGPHWLLLVVAFWAQRRPGALPLLFIFLVALLYEALRDGPLGLDILVLLIASEALAYLARRQPPYTVLDEWLRFVVLSLGLEALVWLALAATYAPTPAIAALLVRWLGGALVYPLLCITLGRLRVGRRLGAPDEDLSPSSRDAGGLRR